MQSPFLKGLAASILIWEEVAVSAASALRAKISSRSQKIKAPIWGYIPRPARLRTAGHSDGPIHRRRVGTTRKSERGEASNAFADTSSLLRTVRVVTVLGNKHHNHNA